MGGKRAEICRHGLPPLRSAQMQVMGTFCDSVITCCIEGGQNNTSCHWVAVKVLENNLNSFRLNENRKLIQTFLVAKGTTDLLEHVKIDDADLSPAEVFARMLLLLEGCDFTEQNPFDLAYSKAFALKHQDLVNGCKRSLVKFYRKRIHTLFLS